MNASPLSQEQVRQIVALRLENRLPAPYLQTCEEYRRTLKIRVRAYVAFLKLKIAAYSSARTDNYTPGIECLNWGANNGVNQTMLDFYEKRLAQVESRGLPEHEECVRHALAEGEEVPDRVMEHYPELDAQYPSFDTSRAKLNTNFELAVA